MNPLCACGCGNEVAHPARRWVLGHSSRRWLSIEDIRLAKLLLDARFSQAGIARRIGCSQATVSKIAYGDYDHRLKEETRPVPKTAAQVERQEDIDERAERQARRQELRQWKVEKAKLRAFQRDLQQSL